MSATPTNRVTDAEAMLHIHRRLGKRTIGVIWLALLRGYDQSRDINSIVALAGEYRATPRVVAAACGFLGRTDGRYADVLTDNSDSEPEELGILPRCGAVALAFALFRATRRDCGQFLTE